MRAEKDSALYCIVCGWRSYNGFGLGWQPAKVNLLCAEYSFGFLNTLSLYGEPISGSTYRIDLKDCFAVSMLDPGDGGVLHAVR